jgi:hypothetical protein
VIALQDAAGTIYWSWHVWVVNYNPNTGGTWTYNNRTFMDRNLGATDNQLTHASHGLNYQWGRKDPFPSGVAGTAGYAAFNRFKGLRGAGSIGREATEGTSTSAEILESIRNPTTYFSANLSVNTYDWLRRGDNSLWGEPEGKKTIYDPCPHGWKIPDARGPIDGDGLYYYFGEQWEQVWETSTTCRGLRRASNGDYLVCTKFSMYDKHTNSLYTGGYLLYWWSRESVKYHGIVLHAHSSTTTPDMINIWGPPKGSGNVYPVGAEKHLGIPVRCVRD